MLPKNNTISDVRWMANSINCANNSGDPYGIRWCPLSCDHIWFWESNPPNISNISSFIIKYLTSIGRSCNMRGLLMEDDKKIQKCW